VCKRQLAQENKRKKRKKPTRNRPIRGPTAFLSALATPAGVAEKKKKEKNRPETGR
jgi:hypothetical protein